MHVPRSTPARLPRETAKISLIEDDLERSSPYSALAGCTLEGAPSSSCFAAELCASSGGLSLEHYRAGFPRWLSIMAPTGTNVKCLVWGWT